MTRLARLTLYLFCLGLPVALFADAFAEKTLKQIVSDQKDILAQIEKQGERANSDDVQTQLQQISQRYESLISENQDFVAAYVAYGQLLRQIGMRKEGTALLMKANRLDSNIPLVKNEIGNFLAEEGKPVEAAQYYLSAIDLEPKEPLYHYQFATLLSEAKDEFIKSGQWTRSSLDRAMLEGFRQASELGTKDWRYAYRYGLAFYDVEKPDWNQALLFWQTYEKSTTPGLEYQVCKLHEARVLGELGRTEEAFASLDQVFASSLRDQKHQVEFQLKHPSPTPTPYIPMAR